MVYLHSVCTAGTDFSLGITCTLDTNLRSLSVMQVTKSTSPIRQGTKETKRAKAAEKEESPLKQIGKTRMKKVKTRGTRGHWL